MADGDKARQFIADELLRCSRCGYCMSVCPTFSVRHDESAVARGRNELVGRALAGGAKEYSELSKPLFDCLLCGACRSACFGCVETADIMVRARYLMQQERGIPLLQRIAFREVLADPPRMRRLMRLVALGYHAGLRDLASHLPGLRTLSASLDTACQMVPSMPKRFLRDTLPDLGFVREVNDRGDAWRLQGRRADGPTVAYLLGCGTDYQSPSQGEAAIRLIALFASSVLVVANRCCGLPPYAYGDLEGAAQLARANVELLAGAEPDVIVSECGSCSGFMRKWPELLAGTDAEPTALRLCDLTRDLTVFLAGQRWEALPSALEGHPVTYHDPCHLSRGQGVTDEPRRLLRDVVRADLREMPEADWCCGGAGTYGVVHPGASDAILSRKMGNIQSTQAELVCTACPACVAQLRRGAAGCQGGPVVEHIAETLCRALAIPSGELTTKKDKPDR